MKTLLPILFFGMLGVISCSKDSSDSGSSAVISTITYPDSAFYGKNILTFPDSLFLLNTKNYGMAAVLQAGATLVLVFTNLSATDSVTGHKPVWNWGDNIGWLADDYNSSANTQKFTGRQQGNIDLQIVFLSFGIHGSCRIDFYENSNIITRTRYLKWK